MEPSIAEPVEHAMTTDELAREAARLFAAADPSGTKSIRRLADLAAAGPGVLGSDRHPMAGRRGHDDGGEPS